MQDSVYCITKILVIANGEKKVLWIMRDFYHKQEWNTQGLLFWNVYTLDNRLMMSSER